MRFTYDNFKNFMVIIIFIVIILSVKGPLTNPALAVCLCRINMIYDRICIWVTVLLLCHDPVFFQCLLSALLVHLPSLLCSPCVCVCVCVRVCGWASLFSFSLADWKPHHHLYLSLVFSVSSHQIVDSLSQTPRYFSIPRVSKWFPGGVFSVMGCSVWFLWCPVPSVPSWSVRHHLHVMPATSHYQLCVFASLTASTCHATLFASLPVHLCTLSQPKACTLSQPHSSVVRLLQ